MCVTILHAPRQRFSVRRQVDTLRIAIDAYSETQTRHWPSLINVSNWLKTAPRLITYDMHNLSRAVLLIARLSLQRKFHPSWPQPIQELIGQKL